MRRICAWCGQELGDKETGNAETAPHVVTEPPPVAARLDPEGSASSPDVTATICKMCAERLSTYRNPVLVISREWARLYEEVAAVLKSRPDIQVIIDRREPSREETESEGWTGPERRKKREPLDLK